LGKGRHAIGLQMHGDISSDHGYLLDSNG
jgi:hypothetical protein